MVTAMQMGTRTVLEGMLEDEEAIVFSNISEVL